MRRDVEPFPPLFELYDDPADMAGEDSDSQSYGKREGAQNEHLERKSLDSPVDSPVDFEPTKKQ